MGLKTRAGEGSRDVSTLERTKARRERGEGRTAVPDESHGAFELRPEAEKEKEGKKGEGVLARIPRKERERKREREKEGTARARERKLTLARPERRKRG